MHYCWFKANIFMCLKRNAALMIYAVHPNCRAGITTVTFCGTWLWFPHVYVHILAILLLLFFFSRRILFPFELVVKWFYSTQRKREKNIGAATRTHRHIIFIKGFVLKTNFLLENIVLSVEWCIWRAYVKWGKTQTVRTEWMVLLHWILMHKAYVLFI